MNILVTAGNTAVPIDQVRCITNIFSGKTGAAIARHAHTCGHTVTLLTSHPEAVAEVVPQAPIPQERWALRVYRTFEDLRELMQSAIRKEDQDVVIHCAAVSDYLSAGIFAPEQGTHFDERTGSWHSSGPESPKLVDRKAGKVKSDQAELWLRLTRAPKLVDLIRSPWGFRGLLVKFKLEVGLNEPDLLRVAENSRLHSNADLMVANTLEDSAYHAYLGLVDGGYEKVSRRELAGRLIQVVERLQGERGHG
jgi:phosphopantothenate---cysteine ligase (CTP)